ncbi:sialidase family protein [Thalassoglobus sp.]|uniref:sialidase family protein n=1 Tax=Thalassoglobus sp. TaxID=2795869 RepID=UPI003AA8D8CE
MSVKQNRTMFPLLTIAVLAVGLGLGFLLPESEQQTPSGTSSKTVSPSAGNEADESEVLKGEPTSLASQQQQVHEFTLSKFDIKDRLQAPAMATDDQGHLWVAWESQINEDERAIFLITSFDNGKTFSEPEQLRKSRIYSWDAAMRGRTIKRSSRMWVNLQFANDRLLLSWVESDKEDLSQLKLLYAESTDFGKTFSNAIQLSTANAVRPTFVAFNANTQGQVAATWLDYRADVQQPFAAISHQKIEEQLVYAGPDDAGICPCCNLEINVTDKGQTIVAFRNSINGYRDMWLAVRGANETQFSEPIPVVEPRWEFNGCPHDGPSLLIDGDQIHMVWMDAHTGVQQVYYGRAKVGEWKFTTRPIHQSTAIQGHAYLAKSPQGVVIVWDETVASPATGDSEHSHGTPSGSGSAIRMVVSQNNGESFSSPQTVLNESGEFQSRPSVKSHGDLSTFAWSSLSENGKKMVITTRLSSTSSESTQVAIHE